VEGKIKRTYKLGGLTSDYSEYRVEETLSQMHSIHNVDVDIPNKQVSFTFEPDEIEEEFIKSTLNTLGYSIQGLVKGNEK
jgi:copper chaperone CopZ